MRSHPFTEEIDMKRSRTLFVFALTTAIACGCGTRTTGPPAAGEPDMIPYTLADTFEDGAINGWESYPYTQDIGCDPGIVCQKTPALGGSSFALAKVVIPNDNVALDIGMTKQCMIRTTASSRVGFAYFLGTDRTPDLLEVMLGSDDGKQYVYRIARPAANQWAVADIPAGAFRESNKIYRPADDTPVPQGAFLAPGTLIRAVIIQARYRLVSSVKGYTTVIDDFRFTGERRRQFIATEPKSTYLDKYYVSFLNRHFVYGETLALSVTPEQGGTDIDLEQVTCTVYDSRNEVRADKLPLADDGSGGDRKAGDGVWSNGSLYRFTDGDPLGIWKLSFEGTGRDGRIMSWDISFIVPGKKPTPESHPRLFFDSAGCDMIVNHPKDAVHELNLSKLLERSRGTLASLRNEDIVESGDVPGEFWGSGEDIAGRFSVSNDAYDRWATPIRRNARPIIEAGAYLYVFAGDVEAGLRAKDALLRVSRFSMWNHPVMEEHARYMYYPVGYLAQAVALGYDLLYSLLGENERAIVRRALIEKSIVPTFRDGTLYNRFSSNLSNHYGVSSAGALMAAAAIYGEDADNPMLEPYLSGILAKFRAHLDTGYLPDGSYQEPAGYHSMDSESRALALDVIERVFGIDWSTSTNFCGSYLYPAYISYDTFPGVYRENRDAAVFGDAGHGDNVEKMGLCLWSARRMQDPLAYTLSRQRMNAGDWGFPGVIWYTGSADFPHPASIEDFPPSRVFPDKGSAVLRSGWKRGDTLLVFRCGPHSNHYHFDQGTFNLVHNGEALLTDAGVTDYYGNLYYQSYYIQPIGHNTMLVDGHPESQMPADFNNGVRAHDRRPRLTGWFTGSRIDALEGSLACVYRGVLDSYTRSFVFVKPDYLVLCDRVAAPKPHTFNWLFHTGGDGSVKAAGSTVTIDREHADLRMDIISPADFTHRIERAPDTDERIIRIDTPSPADYAHFLAVLTPSSGRTQPVSAVAAVRENCWTGVRVSRRDGTDLTVFRIAGKTSPDTVAGYSSDGDAFMIRYDGDGAVRGFWMREGGFLAGETMTTPENRIFTASVPLDADVAYTARGARIEIRTDARADIRVALDREPSQILMNGSETLPFTWSGGMTGFSAPEGTGRFDVKW